MLWKPRAAARFRWRILREKPCRAFICATEATRLRIGMCSRVNGRLCKRPGMESADMLLSEQLLVTVDLAGDQHRALDAILKSTDFITLFRGGAGTGKSFVLRAVQQAIDGTNRSSVVLAPQRQQVIDLARDGLTQTQTVRECLQRGDLAERAVVIVDEAGQIDGRQLLDLIRFVRDRNGRLILCGDAQLAN